MPVPNQFANVTTSIPLSQLDANFNTPITLGNTAIQLGNTVTTLNNMTFANVTITSGTAILTTANVTTGNITNLVSGNVAITGGTANLATGNIANLSSSNAAITGGSITGITDLAIADGGTGASNATVAFDNLSPLTTKGDLIGFDGTDNVRLAVGSNGQVLTANSSATTGLSWAAAGGGSSFPSGTLMLFQQTSAPTGWTKQTTHDNKALRVVSGTASSGGSVGFTTAFASQSVSGTVGSTTLTTTQIPSHTHSYLTVNSNSGIAQGGDLAQTEPTNTGATGGGQSHNHSFTGTAINLAVSYVDLIIASAN